MTADNERKQKILVLGAGYAGLMAALRLAPHHHVTLVDPSTEFTERVRLHELAAGRSASVSHSLSRFLGGTGVQHIAARATVIDPAGHRVIIDDGRTLSYDRLIHALGSRTSAGGDQVYNAETAVELHKRLLDGPGTLAVVGGGFTGIEMAAELAEAHRDWRVRLTTAGPIGRGLSERGRTYIHATLKALGVRVEEGHRIASADAVDADAVLWAASMTANTQLAATAGLALDETGRIRVDRALRSVSHPEILAAGDTAAGLRMACATALPTGSHAAATVLAEARGREPQPLDFRFRMQCVSLGRGDGLIQFVRPDDSPRDRILTGRAAAHMKEQVVRSTVRSLRLAARHPGLIRHIPGLG